MPFDKPVKLYSYMVTCPEYLTCGHNHPVVQSVTFGQFMTAMTLDYGLLISDSLGKHIRRMDCGSRMDTGTFSIWRVK